MKKILKWCTLNKTEKNSIVISVVQILVTLIVFVTCAITFAWFSQNNNVDSSGLNIKTYNQNIYFGSRITITSYIASEDVTQIHHSYTYVCENGALDYYQYDVENNQYVLDEDNHRIPISLSGLFPGEWIDIEMSVGCNTDFNGADYVLSLGSFAQVIEDVTSATRPDTQFPLSGLDDANNEITQEHSTRGLYKVGMITLDENDNEVVNEWNWLGTYNSNITRDTLPSSINFYQGTFKADGYYTNNQIDETKYDTIKFRLVLDLTNYYNNFTNPSSNVLSEKHMRIGAIDIKLVQQN